MFKNNAFAKVQSNVKSGMATGYSPFKFIENNTPTGFDYDVLKQVLSNSQQEFMLMADLWADTVKSPAF